MWKLKIPWAEWCHIMGCPDRNKFLNVADCALRPDLFCVVFILSLNKSSKRKNRKNNRQP